MLRRSEVCQSAKRGLGRGREGSYRTRGVVAPVVRGIYNAIVRRG